MNCFYCGEQFYRRPKDGYHYCYKHHAKERRLECDSAQCGYFLNLYLDHQCFVSIKNKYRDDPKVPLMAVREFLAFLNAKQIFDINEVDKDVVSEYCSEIRGEELSEDIWTAALAAKDRKLVRHGDLDPLKRPKLCRPDFIKVFVDFLRLEGHYQATNPVVRFHYLKKTFTAPRTYSKADVRRLWNWLYERGDERARLIVALAQESGMMPHSICNIRTTDIDMVKRTIQLRRKNPLPGELGYVGTAFYHRKTAECLQAWQRKRPACVHDLLLTNDRGGPLQVFSMNDLLNRIFLKSSDQEGLKKFEFSRLRNGLIYHLRGRGVPDEAIMRMTGILALQTLKNFDKRADGGMIEQLRGVS